MTPIASKSFIHSRFPHTPRPMIQAHKLFPLLLLLFCACQFYSTSMDYLSDTESAIGFLSLIIVQITLWFAAYRALHLNSKSQISLAQESRVIQTTCSPGEVLKKIMSHPLYQELPINLTGRAIALQTRVSLWSWGERIEIIIEDNPSARFKYRVASRSLLPTPWLDWGVNARNVRRVVQLLE